MQIVDVQRARETVTADVARCVARIRAIAAIPTETLEAGIACIAAARREIYEDLNQLQHEYAALRAIEWLVGDGRLGAGLVWRWNPRQTGRADEPDIQGEEHGRVVLSAEVTTSPVTKGEIDTRMAKTLRKLSTMAGRKIYFVTTDAMARSASGKVNKAGYDIEVVRLPT